MFARVVAAVKHIFRHKIDAAVHTRLHFQGAEAAAPPTTTLLQKFGMPTFTT